MIASPFTYVRASSVGRALELMALYGDDAKVLAGGQSLVSMMKLRLLNPATLIDLGDLAELRTIWKADGTIRIGALTTHATLASDASIAVTAPVLRDAASILGDLQVRNLGTIGGSAAHADPAADYPAVLLALDATISMRSREAARSVSADIFFLGTFETVLTDRELLTEIAFAPAPVSAYVKLEHPASGYAVVGAAVRLELAGALIRSARVALTGLSDIAFRSAGVEAALIGVDTRDEAAVSRAAHGAATGKFVTGDQHAPPDYRTAVADVIVERAVRLAATRGERDV